MPPGSLDLDHQLDCLRGLRSDFEEYYWSETNTAPGSERQRYAFNVAIGQLSQRILTLEEIARHHPTQIVRIDGLSADETRALDRAFAVLDGEFIVDDDIAAATMWNRVRRILSATDDLLLAAARAIPDGIAEAPHSPGRGIVVAIARTAK